MMSTASDSRVACGVSSPAAPPSPPHLGYLDGIRGIAALYVLVEHAQLEALALITRSGGTHGGSGAATALQSFAQFLNTWGLGFGHLAVDVFIVLSGYCLMFPVAASPDRSLRGGFSGYVKRRAKRILPPYYAALAFAVAVYVFLHRGGMPEAGNLISHLFLVHNFSQAWICGITPPLWSVAVEWHIYFVFALLLLPVWRHWGGAVMLVIALITGLLPLYLLPPRWNLEWSCPWYIALFGLGMLAATITSAKSEHSRATLLGAHWALMTGIAGMATLGVLYSHRFDWVRETLRMQYRGGSWLLDVMVGITVSFALLSLAQSAASGEGRFKLQVIRVLQSKPVAAAGAFSYSLYLIHVPVLALIATGIATAGLTPVATYFGVYLVGIPLSVLAACVLYLLVERRCMSKTSVQRRRAAEAGLHGQRSASGMLTPAGVGQLAASSN